MVLISRKAVIRTVVAMSAISFFDYYLRSQSFVKSLHNAIDPVQSPTRGMQKFISAFPEHISNISSYQDFHNSLDFGIPVPCNLNIAFMGDSLTRYQYLDLVYFLSHNGTWVSLEDRPNLVIEKTHPDWNDFYEFTNKILKPHENCDCFRNEGQMNTNVVIENRYFHDSRNNNTVTYLQKFGEVPFKTSWNVSDIYHHHELVKNIENVSFVQHFGWLDTVKKFVCKMSPKPSHFIFNSGLWTDSDLSDLDVQFDIVRALRDCDIISIYKTTTMTKNHQMGGIEDRERLCKLTNICLNVSWTGSFIPPDKYWDNAHFYPPIYSMLNIHLLSLLASEGGLGLSKTELTKEKLNTNQ
mmetsp:Transcript_30406/g.61890  ORF Transcript_30406/g.61890 Transcript_30406/m.61890 type:complete len:354 (+) Transcript_30406:76-1137(+)